MNNYHIAFITADSENLKEHFPTAAEPHLIPKEPPFTPDDQLAVDFLRKNNIEISPVVWGTDVNSLKQFDLVILRSPWNYVDADESIIRFSNWLDELSKHNINIENNARFMKWLIDKSYLLDLEYSGVPVVPTIPVNQGQSFNLKKHFNNHGAFVIKPCISAAGKNLFLIKDRDTAEKIQPQFDELLTRKSFVVQPFIQEVSTHGEWSLIFIDNIYSHSVHKKPGTGSILVQTERGGSISFVEPPAEIINFAQENLEKFTLDYNPLYLRVDVLIKGDKLLISEIEGVEPELFFRAKPESVGPFCKAVQNRLTKTISTAGV